MDSFSLNLNLNLNLSLFCNASIDRSANKKKSLTILQIAVH